MCDGQLAQVGFGHLLQLAVDFSGVISKINDLDKVAEGQQQKARRTDR